LLGTNVRPETDAQSALATRRHPAVTNSDDFVREHLTPPPVEEPQDN